MGTLEIILTFISGVVTIAFGGVSILFYRQSKRTKTAEAFSAEVQALKATIETMEKFYSDRVTAQDVRIAKLEDDLKKSDHSNTTLREANGVLEIKNARNKSAINCAYGCTATDDVTKTCPVLKQRAKNEDDYLRSLTKQ